MLVIPACLDRNDGFFDVCKRRNDLLSTLPDKNLCWPDACASLFVNGTTPENIS